MDDSDWSEKKKLKHRILKRAFAENNGPAVISYMSNLASQRQAAAQDREKLRTFELHHGHEGRNVRAVRLLKDASGENLVPVGNSIPLLPIFN